MTTALTPTTTAPDEDKAIAVLVLAFSADPAIRWAWPDPQQYLAHFPRFIRAFGGRAFAQGTAYCIPGYLGAALWLPPGIMPDEEAVMEVFQSSVAEETQEGVFAVLEQMGSYHPSEPHWYLPAIGVDPAHQGNGYGSELMREVLLRCDREGTPAYLESSNPKNIPFYERHGFELLGTIQAGASPSMFPMLRQPR